MTERHPGLCTTGNRRKQAEKQIWGPPEAHAADMCPQDAAQWRTLPNTPQWRFRKRQQKVEHNNPSTVLNTHTPNICVGFAPAVRGTF